MMTEESTVQLELTLTLPDSLAREAEASGLLTPQGLEALLRAEVQRRRIAHVFEAADRLAALPLEPLTEAEVEAEIQAARAERRPHVRVVADTNTIVSGLLWHGLVRASFIPPPEIRALRELTR